MTPANVITSELLAKIPAAYPKIRVWRGNVVNAMAVGRGGNLRRVSAGLVGQSDILGIIGPYGTFLAIEVKAGKDQMRESQVNYRSMIEKHGGIYIIARSVEQCLKDLEAWQ